MGSYAHFWIDDMHVGCTKNGVDARLLDLFDGSDKVVIADRSRPVPLQVRGWLEEFAEDEPLKVAFYRTTVEIARDELELAGVTLDTAKEAYSQAVSHEISAWERDNHPANSEWRNGILGSLRPLDVDTWLASFREIRRRGVHAGSTEAHDSSSIGYLLGKDWCGYPGRDPRVMLRLALEAWPAATDIFYDVTDLILQEQIEIDEDLHSPQGDLPQYVCPMPSRTVIVTEGRSDSWILQESMQLLFPHLASSFTFMDFEGFRVGGGAGALANLVKAFAAAGIANRVIAVFDNDTAAHAALASLSRVRLPANIRLLSLPELDLLRSYPTLGPGGLTHLDVNGMAASIELYLGHDVLGDGAGSFQPVQWTGFEQSMGRYQGEVLGKVELHQRFENKLARARTDRSHIGSMDWDGLRLIMRKIFSAFHEIDRSGILAWNMIDAMFVP